MAVTTLGSVVVLGGLIGAKALTTQTSDHAVPADPNASDQVVASPTGRASVAPTPITPPPAGPSSAGPVPTATPGGASSSVTAPGAVPSIAPPVPTPAPPAGPKDGTFTGQAVSTRYGAVQVEIDVTGGRIDDIRVVRYPNQDRNSLQISQLAIPRLVSEGLAAQSASVDTVSGATYTSDGYRRSLQSAIDQAGR